MNDLLMAAASLASVTLNGFIREQEDLAEERQVKVFVRSAGAVRSMLACLEFAALPAGRPGGEQRGRRAVATASTGLLLGRRRWFGRLAKAARHNVISIDKTHAADSPLQRPVRHEEGSQCGLPTGSPKPTSLPFPRRRSLAMTLEGQILESRSRCTDSVQCRFRFILSPFPSADIQL